MSDEQIKHMVSRFLAWKLPDNFAPDCGITFKRDYNENTAFPAKHEPKGTNILEYEQAVAMVKYMIEGLPASTITALQERVKVLEGVLSDLLITAKMLLANSHGCCANHYAEDYAVHGVPGWLLDSEHSINRARTALGEKH